MPVKLTCSLLLFVVSATAVFSQQTPKTDQPFGVEIVSPKETKSEWLDLLKTVVQVMVGAGVSLLAIWISNRNNRKHDVEMLDLKHRQDEMREVQEWFLRVYSTEAIEPLEMVTFWLSDIVAYDSDDVIPADVQKQAYMCLARIATVIDQGVFVQLFETLIAASAILTQVRRQNPIFYAANCQSLKARLSKVFSDTFRYLNQLQEAMRFTELNHRSDIYRLGKTERFLPFTARADKLIEDVKIRDFTKFVGDSQRPEPKPQPTA